MIDDMRDALPKFGTRFQTATRRLLQATAFFVSLGAVAACGVDAENPAEISAPSMIQSDSDEGDGLQQGSTTMDPSDEYDPGLIQTPPVKLMLSGQSDNHVAMVGVGSTSLGRYVANTEYWRAETGLRITSDLVLTAAPLVNETEGTIDAWLGSLPPAFSCPRPVSASQWSRGTPVFPIGYSSYLLWTPHPDDPEEVLALQLVVNMRGTVTSAVFYRSSAPNADGFAFRANTWQRVMRLLVNQDGTPATDPNLIQTADWHYIVMPLPR